MLTMELLKRVVRQDGGTCLLRDPEQEGVAAPDGACGRRDDLARCLRLLEHRQFRRINAVPERRVDDDRHLGVRVLGEKLPYGLVELSEAR